MSVSPQSRSEKGAASSASSARSDFIDVCEEEDPVVVSWDNSIRECRWRNRRNRGLLADAIEAGVCTQPKDEDIMNAILVILDDQETITQQMAKIKANYDYAWNDNLPEETPINKSAVKSSKDYNRNEYRLELLKSQLEGFPLKLVKPGVYAEWDFVFDSLDTHTDSQLRTKMGYNADFLTIDDGAMVGQAPSRRVVLNNIPASLGLAQILRGIRVYGGIVTASLLKTGSIFPGDHNSALVEFVYPASAKAFADLVEEKNLLYSDKDGAEHPVGAELITSGSHIYGCTTRRFLDDDQTRRITLENFPINMIWFFLNAVGTRKIVYADYDAATGRFTVEFIGLFDADRAVRIIQEGNLDAYNPVLTAAMKFVPDSSQGSIEAQDENAIPYIDLDFLEKQWNTYPFHAFWPTDWRPCMKQAGLLTRAAAIQSEIAGPRRPQNEIIAEQLGIDVDEVEDFLADRRDQGPTQYRIIGSNITLTRRQFGWSILAADMMKLHMANTLHDPEYAAEWDEYFQLNNSINIRKWEEYGVLSQHRRERAAEIGCEA